MGKQISYKGELIAIKEGKIRRSRDNGRTWQASIMLPSNFGNPMDLIDGGDELIIMSDKNKAYLEKKNTNFHRKSIKKI